ncbi:3-hydroxybutyryl-CoA dehydrogenase [Paracoccus alkanivorans]|uniref:L-gulonate 3-dehydrogenase n=1 Tax=Paracoccus alkanivorans TaxID=2116655 RepID=A0A3M0M0Z7_9RHOB|nr:3-hydroxybutyryl-CoA dehydrogenase [Paracoccus alkanivorans]RMC30803.1 3-hydroxybutyryl-CoA dehydrogenase [Paracoccus alkanivorans]
MSRRPVLCLGAGRMGRGIAHAMAHGGHDVRLLDMKPRDPADFRRLHDEALDEIASSLAMVADLGGFDPALVGGILDRISIHPADQAEAAFAGAEAIFEAVPETRDAKAAAFALTDRHAGGDAILASTTSTMLTTELAGLTALPGRTLNAHWLNPAFLVPLVEISPNDQTDPGTLTRLERILEQLGKVPVRCKASPGYIVPRIQALAMNEAARLVEEGVASAEDVDRAVKYGFGLRFGVLGLLEFIDWGGGDILYHASRYMTQATGDQRFAAPAIVNDKMEKGQIGLRTGQGFFDYSDRDIDAYRRERLGAFLAAVRNAGLWNQPVTSADEPRRSPPEQ